MQPPLDSAQQVARVQAIFEQTRIEGAQRRFMELLFAQAGNKCPNLSCVNPLVTTDDAGLSKRVAKVVVNDPDKDHSVEDNLIVLCPGCEVHYSGKNAENISALQSIKSQISKAYAGSTVLDVTGMEDEVTGHVTLWFNFIDDELTSMDISRNWTFERVRHEVKDQYLNLAGRNWSQDEIFERLTQWLI